MLRFFRSSQTIVIVVIFLLGGLTWLHALYNPEEITTSNLYAAPLFLFITGLTENLPVLHVWLGLLLTLLAAMMLIFINNRLHLIDKISYLPALCFVLLIGGVPMIHQFNPQIIATILLMLAFVQLVSSFNNDRVSYSYFTAPILISTAMFFYQYMYVYILVVWFSLLFLRPKYWREWLFSILGFAFPVFIAFGWFFLTDGDNTRMLSFFRDTVPDEYTLPKLSISTLIFFGVSILVGGIAFKYLVQNFGSKKIIVRNSNYILIFIAVVTIALGALIPRTLPQLWYLMAFPLSFFLSNYLATIKSNRWGTIVLAMLFLGVSITQFIFLSSFN